MKNPTRGHISSHTHIQMHSQVKPPMTSLSQTLVSTAAQKYLEGLPFQSASPALLNSHIKGHDRVTMVCYLTPANRCNPSI